jgi:hypothetical protein
VASDAEVRRWHRHEDAVDEGLWATGDEEITPPMRTLTLSGEGRNSQEYGPFPSGLCLPALLVEASSS